MKSFQKYMIVALTAILFASCLSRAIGPTAGESRGSLTADVDGKSWKAQDVSAATLFGSLVLTADRNDGSGFAMSFIGTEPKVGKYTLPSNNANAFGGISYTNEDDAMVFIPESGILEIIKFRDNRVVEGKFEFEGTDFNGNKVSVKNGKFDVTIAF
jgi:hypothetical protein